MDFNKLFENKLFKILAITIGALIVLILVIVLFASLKGGRVSSYSALENKLIVAARNYYQNNATLLPGEVGGKVDVSDSVLTENGYLKEMEKISPKGSTCSGRVVVKNVNGGYFYQAFVNCGDSYQTTTLSSHIKSHVSTVSNGAGLYSVNGDLIYRGENPNNYIKFAGRLYRIVRVRSNDTLDIIAVDKSVRENWDDRYNAERGFNDGINEYSLSRAREYLLNYVNSEAFTDTERNQMEPHSLCVGKVGKDDVITLDMECSNTLEGQVIGLLPISSYMYASLDATCKTFENGTCANYNYLQEGYNWWSITANSATTYHTLGIQSGGSIYSSRCASKYYLREVLRLTENVSYVSGNGTETDPYIVK